MRCVAITVFVGRGKMREPSSSTLLSDNTIFAFPERLGPEYALNHFVEMMNAHREVVVYTRAPDILNFIGHMIAEKLISHEHVKIHVTTPDGDGWFMCSFDKEGFLQEPWPYGYLEPDYDEAIRKLKK